MSDCWIPPSVMAGFLWRLCGPSSGLDLTMHEQHHSFPRLRSSSWFVVAVMVGSSNAEKPEAIHGWKLYKTLGGESRAALWWLIDLPTNNWIIQLCQSDGASWCAESNRLVEGSIPDKNGLTEGSTSWSLKPYWMYSERNAVLTPAINMSSNLPTHDHEQIHQSKVSLRTFVRRHSLPSHLCARSC